MSKYPGIFITIEGGEGAGKSSLIHKLSQELTNKGHFVVSTREPGGTSLGEQIRGLLLNNGFKDIVGKKAELLLFLAARSQHIEEVIEPALKEGKIVLCDRFNDSTIAYQGAGRGLGIDYTQHLCHFTCDLEPNLTLFLDVDPQLGLERTRFSHKENAAKGELDRIEAETLGFHQRINQIFHSLAHQYPERIHIINANKSKDSVFQQALVIIEEVISNAL